MVPTAARFGLGPATGSSLILSIYNVVFDNNSATGDGGAIYDWGPELHIQRSTFVDNEAATGGAVYSQSELNVVNSTFSSNFATQHAGALYNSNGTSQLTRINYSTFYDNIAVHGSGHAVHFDTLALPDTVDMEGNLIIKRPSDIMLLGPSCYAHADITIDSDGGNVVDGCASELTHPSDVQLEKLQLPSTRRQWWHASPSYSSSNARYPQKYSATQCRNQLFC